MEYLEGGDLLERLQKTQKGYIKESEVCGYMEKMIKACLHMHGKNIIHRDLKLENIMFVNKKRDSTLKIIDFGLSIINSNSNTSGMHTKVGTPLYVAPEVLEGKYGPEVDIWGLGVIMYYILCGEPPFMGNTQIEVFEKVRKGDLKFNQDVWQNISAGC